MTHSSKLRRRLPDFVPAQHLVTRRWLLSQGVPRHLADNWVKRRRLVVLRPGVYANPNSSLSWKSVVSSLQRMGSDLVVGGLTSLEQQGRSHFVPLARQYRVNLFGRDPLPPWSNRLGLPAQFHRHGVTWLQADPSQPDSSDSFGLHYPFAVFLDQDKRLGRLRVSTPERAFFEVLNDVPKKFSFEHAELLLDGLPDLIPRRLNALLDRTRSVKIKRLFFWMAKRQGHGWLKYVPEENIDLGSGKRHLVPGGHLNREYLITVPKDMSGDTREYY